MWSRESPANISTNQIADHELERNDSNPKIKIRDSKGSFKTINAKLDLQKIQKYSDNSMNRARKFPIIGDDQRYRMKGEYSTSTITMNEDANEEYQSQYTVKDPHMVFYK